LGGLRQLALMEQYANLPASCGALHESYKAVLARQAAAKAEEKLPLKDSGNAE
jgi:hypothetical protein